MRNSIVGLFKKDVPFYLLVVIVAGTLTLAYFGHSLLESKHSHLQAVSPSCPSSMQQLRIDDEKMVHQLILSDIAEESGSLAPIKTAVQQYINEVKSGQKAAEVSVYFRKLSDGSWFSINANQVYNPASMIKVAYLIAYLKDAEDHPELLSKNYLLAGNSPVSQQNILEKKLKPGKEYSVRVLLYQMIAHSDNDATAILAEHINQNTFQQVFRELNIPQPDNSKEYFINPVDMGKFFRVLYNGTYLNNQSSEFALQLLSQSDFNQGIVAGLDRPMVVAHKFGERILGNTAQLHEYGIVYLDGQPYLLGVMSSGTNLKDLSEVIATISQRAYLNYRSTFGV